MTKDEARQELLKWGVPEHKIDQLEEVLRLRTELMDAQCDLEEARAALRELEKYGHYYGVSPRVFERHAVALEKAREGMPDYEEEEDQ